MCVDLMGLFVPTLVGPSVFLGCGIVHPLGGRAMICQECQTTIDKAKREAWVLENGDEVSTLCEMCFDEAIINLVKSNDHVEFESTGKQQYRC